MLAKLIVKFFMLNWSRIYIYSEKTKTLKHLLFLLLPKYRDFKSQLLLSYKSYGPNFIKGFVSMFYWLWNRKVFSVFFFFFFSPLFKDSIRGHPNKSIRYIYINAWKFLSSFVWHCILYMYLIKYLGVR